ncbi:unnamed protein product [Pleuronectes platessa]|uniref:Uncharacterized protein n=1 Tax=Pleuronectes platessa TaxID=8262 RepID=A0A9N7Y417_PLEPL|nr:unnamed protein product [Pleuronectes platessa]
MDYLSNEVWRVHGRCKQPTYYESSTTPHSLPRVCSTWLITCSSPYGVPAIPMISKLPVIPTLDRVTDSASASSLSVPLPVLLSTRVPTLDWIFTDPCYCLTLIGFHLNTYVQPTFGLSLFNYVSSSSSERISAKRL